MSKRFAMTVREDSGKVCRASGAERGRMPLREATRAGGGHRKTCISLAKKKKSKLLLFWGGIKGDILQKVAPPQKLTTAYYSL